MNMNNFFVMAVVGASLGMANGASASTMPGSYSKTVGYSDLNLSTPAGEEALSHRLNVAARQACRKVNQELASQAACRSNALALAAPRADAVVYAARFASKTAEG